MSWLLTLTFRLASVPKRTSRLQSHINRVTLIWFLWLRIATATSESISRWSKISESKEVAPLTLDSLIPLTSRTFNGLGPLKTGNSSQEIRKALKTGPQVYTGKLGFRARSLTCLLSEGWAFEFDLTLSFSLFLAFNEISLWYQGWRVSCRRKWHCHRKLCAQGRSIERSSASHHSKSKGAVRI